MSVAFSTPDGDIITEKVSVDQVEATPQSELRRRYHLDECVAWITTHQYRTVGVEGLSAPCPSAYYLSCRGSVG